MSLEAVSFPNDLTITNPVAGDPRSEGDDHLRNIKTAIKAAFPGLAGRSWRKQSKAIGYTVLTTDNMSVIEGTVAITLTLTAAATLGNGFMFLVSANGGAVIVDPDAAETINGAATYTVTNGNAALVVCDGSAFFAFGWARSPDLTGPITSVGAATAVAAQTGTGSTFVMQTSPILTTPNLGTPSAAVLTNATGTATGLTAGNVTTNANLTGPITSVGNATAVTTQTGTGSVFVMQVSPTLTTPNIGVATGTSFQGIIGNVTPAAGTFTTGVFSGTVTLSGAAANIALGANFISYGGTDVGFSLDASNNATLSGNLIVSSPGQNAIGGVIDSNVQLRQTGTIAALVGFELSTRLQPAIDQSGRLFDIIGTIDIGASGTHLDFASIIVRPPMINAGVASLTNASALKITGAPTAATNNYGLWNIGNSRMDSSLWVESPLTEGASGEQLTSGGAATIMSWTAAACVIESKRDVRRIVSPAFALQSIIDTPIYGFHYKDKQEEDVRPITTGDTDTEYVGPMAHEAPWAMHHGGRILNPINALGYTVLAMQAMETRIAALEALEAPRRVEVAELRGRVQ